MYYKINFIVLAVLLLVSSTAWACKGEVCTSETGTSSTGEVCSNQIPGADAYTCVCESYTSGTLYADPQASTAACVNFWVGDPCEYIEHDLIETGQQACDYAENLATQNMKYEPNWETKCPAEDCETTSGNQRTIITQGGACCKVDADLKCSRKPSVSEEDPEELDDDNEGLLNG